MLLFCHSIRLRKHHTVVNVYWTKNIAIDRPWLFLDKRRVEDQHLLQISRIIELLVKSGRPREELITEASWTAFLPIIVM